MITLDGYTADKSLGAGEDSETCRATRTHDDRRVTLKRYDGAATGQSERQHALLSQLEIAGVVRPLDLDRLVQPPVLVLDYVPGQSLADASPLGLATFFDIAVDLADTLAELHGKRVLHNDIDPSHVIMKPGRTAAVLIGFRIATRLGGAETSAGRANVHYAGPEHSGRTALAIDFRSDLYALGSTLYHALTGRPPFTDEDPLALIHAHVARPPISPTEHRGEIPTTLSRVVQKLLAKDPTHRYQTAIALRADLVECRKQFLELGQIEEDMPLGAADAPLRPMFSRRLYGREKESQVLVDGWRHRADRTADFFVVHGGAGFGKSALIDALRAELAGTGGYVARGKFEAQRTEHPYFGVVQALAGLVDQILAEGERGLEKWRARLADGLGNLARVIVSVVPDLGTVLGTALGAVPPVPAVGPDDERERFALAVRRFLSAFASSEHPLLIVLDDLHWADAPSLRLVRALVSTLKRSSNLMLVGTWRDTEDAHRASLDAFVAKLDEAGLRTDCIGVGPLGVEASAAMLREALQCDDQSARHLAELTLRKTGGSPFLIQQFIQLAHDRGQIEYRYPSGWSFDARAIEQSDVSDDAVGLLVEKLHGLDPRTLELVRLASCIGMESDLELLDGLCDLGRGEIESRLCELSQTGLVAPSHAGFRFTHDRIREAAQALITEEERARVRVTVGQALLHQLDAFERDARTFEIADHLRCGLDAIAAPSRVAALETLTSAGQKALAAVAAESAAHYVGAARALFDPADWRERRSLGLSLHRCEAATEHRRGRSREALEILGALESLELAPLERAPIATLRTAIVLDLDGPHAAIASALGDARKVGLRWSRSPSVLHVGWALLRLEHALRTRRDRMLAPAPGADPETIAQLIILAAAGPAAVQVGSPVGVLTMCFGLQLYMRIGYLATPVFALSAYALFCCMRGRIERAKEYAELALEWTRQPGDPQLVMRARFTVHALVRPLYSPREHTLAALPPLTREALELGSEEYSGYALLYDLAYRALGGENLDRLRDRVEAIEAPRFAYTLELLRQAIALTRAAPGDARALAEALFALPEDRGAQASVLVWPFAAQILLVHGHPDLAIRAAERARAGEMRIGRALLADLDLTLALALARTADAGESRPTARSVRSRLRRTTRALAKLAEHGPDFVHMADLARAELECARGQTARSLAVFERAAVRAGEIGFLHVAGFAHERRGAVLRAARRETEAANAFARAIAAYVEWGAIPKARQVRDRS